MVIHSEETQIHIVYNIYKKMVRYNIYIGITMNILSLD